MLGTLLDAQALQEAAAARVVPGGPEVPVVQVSGKFRSGARRLGFRSLILITLAAGASLTAAPVLAASQSGVSSSPQVLCCSGSSGFWLGTDGSGPTVSGSAPYYEPYVDAYYGAYVGEIGGWWDMPGKSGCGYAHFLSANINAANVNLASYGYGVGAGAYWFMGGPGMDPNYGTYGGSAKEAWTWGVLQAKAALSRYDSTRFSPGFNFPVLFMDIEGQEDTAPYTNGWNGVVASGTCHTLDGNGISYTVDRCTFNGFWDWLEYGSGATPGSLCDTGGSQALSLSATPSPEGVCCGPGQNPAPGAYSSHGYWSYTFGNQGAIKSTWEWTSVDEPNAYNDSNTSAPAPTVPNGSWNYDYNSPPEPGTSQICEYEGTSSKSCSYTADADFFGGQSAGGVHALMWQWDAIPPGTPKEDFDEALKSILPSGW
ncbi:MAG: hypothetical protein M0T72_03760 [Candidatus Dormibacteraeota bacterium]|nr:hypothetical protein [Candidatus Dormibacteraeota bacterium]